MRRVGPTGSTNGPGFKAICKRAVRCLAGHGSARDGGSCGRAPEKGPRRVGGVPLVLALLCSPQQAAQDAVRAARASLV